MVKLKDYFDKKGIHPVKFATKNNISTTSIYRYMRGETSPSRERAKIIVEATEGEVTMNDLRGGND